MQGLFGTDHINRTVHRKLIELASCQGQVFGRVKGIAVGFEQHKKTKILCFKINPDGSLRTNEGAVFFTFKHHLPPFFIDIGFIKIMIKMNIKPAVDFFKIIHRPLLCFFPDLAQLRIFLLHPAKQITDLSLCLLRFLAFQGFQKLDRLGIEFPKPLSPEFIRRGFITVIEEIPETFCDMGADISEIIRCHNFIPVVTEDPAKRVSQSRIS